MNNSAMVTTTGRLRSRARQGFAKGLALLVLAASAGALRCVAQNLPKAPMPLTHADQVRQLSAEQAAQTFPVKIRGVITADFPAPDFFIQDSTAGIYVEGNRSTAFPHHLGDLVELEGFTGPGKFAPVVREQQTRVIGQTTLPQGKLYSFNELADGRMDSQWVKVRGIIRSVDIDRTSWHETVLAMRVASGNGEFVVRVPITQEQDFSPWINREVLIEGVCGSLFTSRRQLSGILFYVPRMSYLHIEPPARETSVSALLQFSPGQGRRRVRVRGVVAYQQPGSALFLESQGSGLRVLSQQDTRVEPGDVVEVFGYPAMGESAPILSDGVFHRVDHGAPPSPVKLRLEEPWEQFDGALVTVDALLLERQSQNSGLRLMLRSGHYLFEADAISGSLLDRISSIPLNSELQITGVCLVRSGGLWPTPQSLRLLLRSTDDIRLRRAPSWWNFRHAMWLLGISVGVLLIVLAWMAVLGRRLREQMALVRQKLRSGAVLEERNRIARELHDSLEQELAGITMQLDLASDCFDKVPRVAQDAIENARRMSRHSMLEARRSVWDLRCHLLESGDLVSALAEIIKPLVPAVRVKLNLKTYGSPVRLPSPVEMNLLRIAQEAVANAIKHGGCGEITVELGYAPGRVRLSVKDNGCGFVPSLSPGHFGLLDMRERAQSMAAHLEVDSQPGKGTKVSVEMSVSGTHQADEESKAQTYSGR
jgi:signal transduction histidine kinase